MTFSLSSKSNKKTVLLYEPISLSEVIKELINSYKTLQKSNYKTNYKQLHKKQTKNYKQLQKLFHKLRSTTKTLQNNYNTC